MATVWRVELEARGWRSLNGDHRSTRTSGVACLFAFCFCLPAAGRKRWGRFSLALLLGRLSEAYDLVERRTRPGSTTAKAPCRRTPSLATASTTVAVFTAARAVVKSHQKYTCRRMPMCVHQSAKIKIFGDKYPLFLNCTLQNLLVGGAACDFGDGNHVMARFAKSAR